MTSMGFASQPLASLDHARADRTKSRKMIAQKSILFSQSHISLFCYLVTHYSYTHEMANIPMFVQW